MMLRGLAAFAWLPWSCGTSGKNLQLSPVTPSRSCEHCSFEEAFEEFLKKEDTQGPSSEVYGLWSTHVEVVPITSDIGGWEDPSFHENLAKEAIREWKHFRDGVVPKLPEDHELRELVDAGHAGSLNDGFYRYQRRLFEAGGDPEKALREDTEAVIPGVNESSTWPQLEALPEYRRLRQLVQKLSRRYLVRSGMKAETAHALNYSIFNWAAVHGRGEFHGPHTHLGEYHVAVFYAQAGPTSGKFRLLDPRGHSPPFGRDLTYVPRAGELLLFPAWLSHMATVTTSAPDSGDDGLRAIFSFNIGPASGPLPSDMWWSDPTSDLRWMRKSKIDIQKLGLEL